MRTVDILQYSYVFGFKKIIFETCQHFEYFDVVRECENYTDENCRL